MQYGKGAFIIFSTVFLSVVSLSPVSADVTVERVIKSGGIGGVGASESYEKEFIKGPKKREDSKTKFTGAILGKLTGEQTISTVYRIDKDLIWDINHPKKSYTERTISMPASKKEEGGEDVRREEGMDKKEEEEVKIIKNEFKVKATGEKKTINSFPCEQYIVTWLVETENIKTKERSTSLMTTELWNTEEDSRIRMLQKEEASFNQAYMKKLGLEMTPEEMQNFGLNMMGQAFSDAAEELKKEMSKIKGYPIATTVKWEAETDEKAKAQSESRVQEEQEENEGIDVSKGLGGIMGGFIKKKMEAKQKEKKTEEEKKGKKPIFESYLEIKGIDISTLADSAFDVPAGYKKVDH